MRRPQRLRAGKDQLTFFPPDMKLLRSHKSLKHGGYSKLRPRVGGMTTALLRLAQPAIRGRCT